MEQRDITMVRWRCPHCGKRQRATQMAERSLVCKTCKRKLPPPRLDVPCMICGADLQCTSQLGYVTTGFVGGLRAASAEPTGSGTRIEKTFFAHLLVRFSVPVCTACWRRIANPWPALAVLVLGLLGAGCAVYGVVGEIIGLVSGLVCLFGIYLLFQPYYGALDPFDLRVLRFVREATGDESTSGWRVLDCWDVEVGKRPDWRWVPSDSSDSGTYSRGRPIKVEDFLDLDWPSFKTWAQAHRLVNIDREEKKYNPFQGTEVQGDRPEAREIVRDPRMVLQRWAKSADGLARLRAAMAQLSDEEKERTCCRLLQEDGGQDCQLLLKAFLEGRVSELLKTLRLGKRVAIVGLVVIASAVAVLLMTKSFSRELDRISELLMLVVIIAASILGLVAVGASVEWASLGYCRRLLGKLTKDS